MSGNRLRRSIHRESSAHFSSTVRFPAAKVGSGDAVRKVETPRPTRTRVPGSPEVELADKPIVTAVSVAMRRGDRLLLVRRGRAPSRGFYAFPGGRVEPGEPLEAAARRELLEETALEPGELRPLARIRIEGAEVDYDLHVFATHHAGGEPAAGDDADEAGFFTLAEMQAMEVPEAVLAAAGEILSAEAPFDAGRKSGSPA